MPQKTKITIPSSLARQYKQLDGSYSYKRTEFLAGHTLILNVPVVLSTYISAPLPSRCFEKIKKRFIQRAIPQRWFLGLAVVVQTSADLEIMGLVSFVVGTQ